MYFFDIILIGVYAYKICISSKKLYIKGDRRMKNSLKYFIGLSAVWVLVGCGSSSKQNLPTGTGYYEDGAISGVDYKCGSKTGVTGKKGEFIYEQNKGCQFSLGDVVLENKTSDIFKSKEVHTRIADENAINLLSILDLDSNPDDGFQIDHDAAVKTLKDLNITNIHNVNLPFATIVSSVGGKYKNNLSSENQDKYSVPDPVKLKSDLEKHQTKQTKNIFAGKTVYFIDDFYDNQKNQPVVDIYSITFDENMTTAMFDNQKLKVKVKNGVVNVETFGDFKVQSYNDSVAIVKIDSHDDNDLLKLYFNKADVDKRKKEILSYYKVDSNKIKSLIGKTMYDAEKDYASGKLHVETVKFNSDKIIVDSFSGKTKNIPYTISNDTIILNGKKKIKVIYISDEKVMSIDLNGEDKEEVDIFYFDKNKAIENPEINYGNDDDMNDQNQGGDSNGNGGSSEVNQNNHNNNGINNDNGNSNDMNDQNHKSQTSPIQVTEENIKNYVIGKYLYHDEKKRGGSHKFITLKLSKDGSFYYKKDNEVTGTYTLSNNTITVHVGEETKIVNVVYISTTKIGLQDKGDTDVGYWYFNQTDAKNNPAHEDWCINHYYNFVFINSGSTLVLSVSILYILIICFSLKICLTKYTLHTYIKYFNISVD